MAIQGPLSAGLGQSVASDTGGNWATPTNIYTSNNARSTWTFVSGQANIVTWQPRLVARSFGFNIPTFAVIQGITATVEIIQTGGSTGTSRTNLVQLVKANNTPIGTNKSTTTVISTTEEVRTYGGPADLWGTTWTPAEINSANFGLTLRVEGVTATNNRVIGVDHVTISVTYLAEDRQVTDKLTFTQATGEVFAANGQFEFIPVETNATTLFAPQVNIPETINVDTRASVQTGLDANAVYYYLRDTGVQFFKNVVADTTGATYMWQNPQNVLAADGNFATVSQPATSYVEPLVFDLSDLSLVKGPGQVKGIEIFVQGSQTWSGGTAFGTATVGPTFSIIFGGRAYSGQFTAQGQLQNVVFGGESNALGFGSIDEIAQTGKLALTTQTYPVAGQGSYSNVTTNIDYITMRVVYTAANPYTRAYTTEYQTVTTPITQSSANYTGGNLVNWSNVDNVAARDGSVATVTLAASSFTGSRSGAIEKPLSDFNVPLDARITAFEFDYAYTGGAGGTANNGVGLVSLVKPTSSSGDTRANYLTPTAATGSSTNQPSGSPGIAYITQHLPVDWAPGAWNNTGLLAFQMYSAASGFGSPSQVNMDYMRFRVIYELNAANEVPVLPFIQTGKDVQALGATAIPVDTREYVMTGKDVASKNNELIPVTTRAFVTTRRDAFIVEKQLIPTRAFVQTRLDAKISERLPVTTFTFSTNRRDAFIVEKQLVSTLGFTQTNPELNVAGATLFDIDTRTFVQTRLDVNINANERVAVPRLQQVQVAPTVNLNAREAVAVPKGTFTQTNKTVDIFESTAIPVGVKPFTQTTLDVNINAREKIAMPAKAFTQVAQFVRLSEGVNVPSRAFDQTEIAPNLNAKEVVAVPSRAFNQNELVVTVNEGTSIGVPVLDFVLVGRDANLNAKEGVRIPTYAFSQEAHVAGTNAKTKVTVDTKATEQSEYDVKLNERIPVGVTAFLETTQVVKLNERLPVGTKSFEQASVELKLNERIPVSRKAFVQTAQVTKTTEVLNSFGTLAIVQTTYEISFPDKVRVSSASFAMELLGVSVPTVLNVLPLSFTQGSFYPTAYSELVPTLVGRIRWQEWVPGPDGVGAMLADRVETGIFHIGDRIRYTLPAEPVIRGRLVENSSDPDAIPVVAEI